MLRLKRAYEAATPADGYRVLVERLWPRGLRKEAARFDEWLKDVAPSHELRKWFGHDPERWDSFRARYRLELRESGSVARTAVDGLVRRAKSQDVTLVYSAHDQERNSAVVLKEEIEMRSKAGPPRETGAREGSKDGEGARRRPSARRSGGGASAISPEGGKGIRVRPSDRRRGGGASASLPEGGKGIRVRPSARRSGGGAGAISPEGGEGARKRSDARGR